MHRTLAVVISVLVVTMTGVPASRAAETVWSGLVIADNVTEPEAIPPELNRIEGLLKKFSATTNLRSLDNRKKTLKTGQEDWLATSKFFGLHVDARGETQRGYV